MVPYPPMTAGFMKGSLLSIERPPSGRGENKKRRLSCDSLPLNSVGRYTIWSDLPTLTSFHHPPASSAAFRRDLIFPRRNFLGNWSTSGYVGFLGGLQALNETLFFYCHGLRISSVENLGPVDALVLCRNHAKFSPAPRQNSSG